MGHYNSIGKENAGPANPNGDPPTTTDNPWPSAKDTSYPSGGSAAGTSSGSGAPLSWKWIAGTSAGIVGAAAALSLLSFGAGQRHDSVTRAESGLKGNDLMPLTEITGKEKNATNLVSAAWENVLLQGSKVDTFPDAFNSSELSTLAWMRKDVFETLSRITGDPKYSNHISHTWVNVSDLHSTPEVKNGRVVRGSWTWPDGFPIPTRFVENSTEKLGMFNEKPTNPEPLSPRTEAAVNRLFILRAISNDAAKFPRSSTLNNTLVKVAAEDSWPEVREAASRTLEVVNGVKSK